MAWLNRSYQRCPAARVRAIATRGPIVSASRRVRVMRLAIWVGSDLMDECWATGPEPGGARE